MRIGGRSLREYLHLLGPLFGLIAAVWGLRLVIATAGLPAQLVRILSVTVATSICILLAAVLIHVRRFGGYSALITAVFLLVVWGQLLISAAILLAMVTGQGNVYTEPEYAGHSPTLMLHLVGHLTFGIGFSTLFGAGMACVLFWLIRKVIPPQPHKWSRPGGEALKR
jgi:hypothetical protein